MDILVVLLVVTALAQYLTERLGFIVEFISLLLGMPKGPAMKLASVLVGVALCLALQLDALDLLGIGDYHKVIGQIITGLIVGGGSNVVHQFFKRYI